ncbi:MAG: methyltransferase domain-containing protein [Sphingobacteriales bacterium]|nr:MAG: methyltransferase domain-containing protein [Sphingobacteriales bacterium]
MNSYFQFKQFRIEQDRCAMKVSTDACIQGAWTPVLPGVKNVLDIGAGTGLLSLMLTQKNDSIKIDAIELDSDAAAQADENFRSSPWNDRLHVFQGSVQSFTKEKKYDLIICNPPFFNNSLLGPDAIRNTARHTNELSYLDIIDAMENLLGADGYASILLPTAEHKVWSQQVAEAGWFIHVELQVQPLPHKSANRIVSICSRKESPTRIEQLCIYKQQGIYTDAFVELMHPYYLQL